jgi:hypothetical protein
MRQHYLLDWTGPPRSTSAVIYCVIPPELESELFARMVEHYKDNPGVEVIVDRRKGGANDRRRGRPAGEFQERRETRDRRRARVPGTFPRTEGQEAAG